jgi:hypothetical protein
MKGRNKVKSYEEKMKKVNFFRINETPKNLKIIYRNRMKCFMEHGPSFLLRTKQKKIVKIEALLVYEPFSRQHSQHWLVHNFLGIILVIFSL